MINDPEPNVVEVVPPERVRVLRHGSPGSGPVLYWLQRAARTVENAALEASLEIAARWDRPVLVVAVLDPHEPGLSERTAWFALQGLRDVRDRLRERGVGFACVVGDTVEVVAAFAAGGAPDDGAGGAAAVVVERAYLRHEAAWRATLAARVTATVLEVEGELIVPVERAANRAVYAARSLRPTLERLADDFVTAVPRLPVARRWPPSAPRPAPRVGVDVTAELDRPAVVVARLGLGGTAPRADRWYDGGESRAEHVLGSFVAQRLHRYARDRRLPAAQSASGLGMYLRFGHVSPARVVRAVRAAAHAAPADAVASFQEELLVRRELAANFVAFTPHYDRYEAVPAWARASLALHTSDPRPATYDVEALSEAETHDPAWNAAMLEMRITGYLHNHMRMYWGKKILEWSETPEAAFAAALTLNDRYFLDGRDPNSYAGVGWLFGLHDRPWGERPIYGMVRSMTAGGLRRKSDPDAYVRYVHDLVATAPA